MKIGPKIALFYSLITMCAIIMPPFDATKNTLITDIPLP